MSCVHCPQSWTADYHLPDRRPPDAAHRDADDRILITAHRMRPTDCRPPDADDRRRPRPADHLNLSGHDSALRSYLHAGSDDVYMPAPLRSPAEIITLFIERLCRPANREKWRAPTNFEIEWFLTTHNELASRGSRTSGTSGG